MVKTREPLLIGGQTTTVGLLVLTSLDELLFKLKLYISFYQTIYLNEEVNRTEHSLQ
jgi:hypothetical protein